MKFPDKKVGGRSESCVIGIFAQDQKSLGICNPKDQSIFIAQKYSNSNKISNKDFYYLEPLAQDEDLAKKVDISGRLPNFNEWLFIACLMFVALSFMFCGIAQTWDFLVWLFNWPLTNFILVSIVLAQDFYTAWLVRPWHGAEHMACHALRKGEYATIEDITKQSRLIDSCGTRYYALIFLTAQLATFCAIFLPSPAILWQIILLRFITENRENIDLLLSEHGWLEIILIPFSRFFQFFFTTSRPGKIQLQLAYAVTLDLVAKLETQKASALPIMQELTQLLYKFPSEWDRFFLQYLLEGSSEGCPSRKEIAFFKANIELIKESWPRTYE